MTWSHPDSKEVRQKQSRIFRRGVKLDKAGDAGCKDSEWAREKEKTTEFARYDAELQYFEALPQRERKQKGEQEREWKEGSPQPITKEATKEGGALILKA